VHRTVATVVARTVTDICSQDCVGLLCTGLWVTVVHRLWLAVVQRTVADSFSQDCG
jgi:hypothetical protein